MRAKALSDLLKKDDRVAVSNITGREARNVTVQSYKYSKNIIGGWALNKSGEVIECLDGNKLPVFGNFEELMLKLPENKRPNKIIVYSPPEVVYGEVKEIIKYSEGKIETIYIITEHVSIEVTAKIHKLSDEANIDVVGCNTLGVINTFDHVRIGAVGGDNPEESFLGGKALIVSNSGNMVTTVATYIKNIGIGTSYGISTGKDPLILFPLKEILKLTKNDPKTKLIVLYIEPGGIYEEEAIATMIENNIDIPIVAYVSGRIAEEKNVSLGHAGAVVEGEFTSASAKMKLFDDYFGISPYDPDENIKNIIGNISHSKRGIRVTKLHHLTGAVNVLIDALEIKRDFKPSEPLKLNPWFVNYCKLLKKLPSNLILHKGKIVKPYNAAVKIMEDGSIGYIVTKQDMRNASHASSSDGKIPRLYGNSLLHIMEKASFPASVLIAWLGIKPKYDFEITLFSMGLIASMTNGPGTISAQGAKLSASARNNPNTAMIATLATVGSIHGGNGREATRYLIDVFRSTGLVDPYHEKNFSAIKKLAEDKAKEFYLHKLASLESGLDYKKIPCMGHPVFNREMVNYDPRERKIYQYLQSINKKNVFLEYYLELAKELKNIGATKKVLAVNVDAAIASICLGITWPFLIEKKLTMKRALDFPFVTFALGRVAGGAGEFLDHQDYGEDMDMRIPISELRSLTRAKD